MARSPWLLSTCLPRETAIGYLGNREVRVSKPSDLVQGTLDLLLLKILALESMNGWSISQRLRQISGEVLQVSDGSLYPALHRLEAKGLVAATWDLSEKGKRARYYRLTPAGRKNFATEQKNWEALSRAMGLILKPLEQEGK